MRVLTKRIWLWILLIAVIWLAIYLVRVNSTAGSAALPDLKVLDVAADDGGWSTTRGSATPDVPGMRFVGENEYLALFISDQTTEIAIADKRTRAIWYSNPPGRNEDVIATAYEKETMSSQIYFSFIDSLRQTRTFYNYQHAIKNGQFAIEDIPNGIRIVYTIGDMSRGIESLPQKISQERFQSLVLDRLPESEANYVKRRWRLNEETGVYERVDSALNSQLTLNRVLEAFDAAGYTPENLNEDNIENGLPEAEINRPIFVIPLEYRLDGETLVTSIPAWEIREPDGVRIRELTLLPYFGAAGQDQEGYMLVPDGSGSIIRLNNGKTAGEQYAQRVYGRDEAKEVLERVQVSETARLPVFGMRQGDRAMFAIIEGGDALSTIIADISGKQNTYNTVFSRFIVRDYEELEVVGQNNSTFTVPIEQPRRYEGTMAVRYAFLYGDEASYAGMAGYYRQYLIDRYGIESKDEARDLPFYLDLVGAINKQQFFLGIPYQGTETLTTFEQASEIASKFAEQGIGEMRVRLQGWFNEGVNHKNTSRLSVDSKLGGSSGLKKLARNLEEQGIELYPDVAFMHIYQKSSGFIAARDTARFINRKPAKEYPVFLPNWRNNLDYDPYYIVSSPRLPTYVEPFLSRFGKLGLDGLSLRDLASLVNSDNRASRPVNRQESLEIVRDQLAKVAEQVDRVMAGSPNAYALPFITDIFDMPLGCSQFNITDACVPFYQMVVHGLIPYTGSSVNLNPEQDYQLNLLRHLEYGAGLHFTLAYASSSKVKETQFDYLFSTHYTDWMDYAVSMYQELNDVLKLVRGVRMIDHQELATGVYETSYENGVSVIVNYNPYGVEVDGARVAGMNYIVKGAENGA